MILATLGGLQLKPLLRFELGGVVVGLRLWGLGFRVWGLGFGV